MASKANTKKTGKKRRLSRKGKNIVRKSIAGVLIATGLLVAAIPEDRSGVASADSISSNVINLNQQYSPLDYDADSLESRNGDFAFPYANAESLKKEGQTIYTSFIIDNSTGRPRLVPDFEYFIPNGGIDGKNVGVTSRFCNQDTKKLEFDGVIITGYEMVTPADYQNWWNTHDTAMGFSSYTQLPTDNQLNNVKKYFGEDTDFIDWESKYRAALAVYQENHPDGPAARTFADIGMDTNIFDKNASEMPEAKKYVYYCDQNNMKGFTLALVSNLVPGRNYLLSADANNPANNVSDVMPSDSEIYVAQILDANDTSIPENVRQKCDANGYKIKAYQNIEAIGEGTFAKTVSGNGAQYYSELKNVVFKGNIKYIADRAFEGSTIESVEIPSVKYIGNYVFKDCANLTSITFNTDTQHIGKEAFAGCKKLKSLTMPTANLEIGFGAFSGCTELGNVDFNTNQNTGANIGEYAFYNCVNLNNATFYPYGEYAFGKACFALPAGSGSGSSISAASPLTTFTFPQIKQYKSYTDPGFTSYDIYDENQNQHSSEIGDYLLANRSDLDSVKMPPDFGSNNPQWIPMNMFDNCRNLGFLEFDSRQNSYVYYDSNLFEEVENTKLRVFGPQNKFYTDTINNSTIANPRYSTWHATTHALDYVPYVYVDSNGVEHYEVGKDEYRYELQINPDNTTASIISCELINPPADPDHYVFEEDFIIPGQVADFTITELADQSLDGVKNYIKRLVVADDSLQFIDENVFSESKNLEEVIMGNSMKTIGKSAFSNCPKLEKVTIGDGIETVSDEAFFNCPKLEHVYWDSPEGESYMSAIGLQAFKTNGDKLYFHCNAESDYQPFVYAMGDNVINDGSVRICVKTPEPAVYTILMDEMTGYPTLIDYPLYADLDADIRRIYENGLAGNSGSSNTVSGNNLSTGTLNNEQQAKLDATLYLSLPEAVESIDIKSFLNPDANNTNQKNWIYAEDSSTANFITVNGNHTKQEIFEDDDLKINSSPVKDLYTDGYTAGLFSGYLDDKTPLIAYGNSNYPTYQEDVKGNDWILSVEMPGVVSIPDYAFDSCERLQSVIIGDNCENIGEAAFQGCDQLATIGTNNNQKYQFDNKILYETKDDGTLEINTCLPSRGVNNQGSEEIWVETANDPLLSSVTSIKEGAFSGCDKIKKVDLTDTTVERIPQKCFYECDTLSDVTLPETTRSVAAQAFDNGAQNLNLTVPCDSQISDVAFDEDSTVTIWTYPECTITSSYRASNNDTVYIKYLSNRYYITFLNDDMTVYEKIPVEAGANGYYPETDPVPKLASNANGVFSYWNFDNPNGIKNVTENRTAQAVFELPSASVSASSIPTNNPQASSLASTQPSSTASAGSSAQASGSPGTSASASPTPGTSASATPSSNAVTYVATVENGAGTGSYQPGSVVTITAYAPETGKEFDQWTTSNADIGFSNNKAVSTTFIMPTHDVKVTATYKTAGSNSNSGNNNNSNNSGNSSVSGNNSGNNNSSTGNNRKPGTEVTVTTETIDNNNKNLVSATVSGSTDNFVVKITDSAAAYAEVEQALKNVYGNDLSNIKFVGFDISLYDATGQNKVQNYDGLAVTITIPIPDDLVSYAGNNQAVAVVNGALDQKATRFTTIDGVPCMTFTATHFSPYGVYVNTANLSAGVSDETPKTGDISPKWFLAIGLCCIGIVMFLWQDKKKTVTVK